MVRGIYYDGWKPASVPSKIRTRQEFIEDVRERARGHEKIDPNFAIQGVFRLLERKIEGGQIRKVVDQMPQELRSFWQNPNP